MAEPRNSGGAGTIVNVGLMIVTIAGFLTLVPHALTSDRPAPAPSSNDGSIGSQTVDARLWEDPFRPPPKKGEPPRPPLADLAADIRAKVGQTDPYREVWLLPVMVSGGPYSEDREDRIRTRFAVVSALGRSGYAPKDEAHVGYVETPWPTTRELANSAPRLATASWMPCSGLPCSDTLAIPYEWYRSRTFYPGGQDPSRPDVLVLWLDERFFEDDPTARLPILLTSLIAAARGDGAWRNAQPVVHLIGPQTSKTLRAMLRNDFSERDLPVSEVAFGALAGAREALQSITVYSATASAMDEVLVPDVPAGSAPRERVRRRLKQLGFADAHFLNLDDARVADEVLQELALRNLCLTGTEPTCQGQRRDHIVLLSEWDTFYGRMLALTYGAALTTRANPDAPRDDHRQSRFRMLRLALLLVALLGVLALYFWLGPMRMRTAFACGYLSACFPLSEADIGGPEGGASLLKAIRKLANADALCKELLDRLEDRLAPVPAASVPVAAVRGTIVASGGALALRAAVSDPEPEVVAATAVVMGSTTDGVETFVTLLNDIVHHETADHETRIDSTAFERSRLVDQAVVHRAAPCEEPAASWNIPGRLRQRFHTRALVDQLLDRLTKQTDDPNRLELVVAHDARFAANRMFRVRAQLVAALGLLGVVALTVAGTLLDAIWHDTFVRTNGEPFSLTDGTSAWPNLVVRVASTFVACAFVCWLFEQLRVLFYQLTRIYRLPLTASAVDRSRLRIQASALWKEYHDGGKVWHRVVRAGIPMLVYFWCARLVLTLFGLPVQPLRGESVTWWAGAVRYPFVLSFLLLSFLTIDAALRCRHFVTALAALPTHYPRTTLEYFKSQRGGIGEEYLEEWIDIQLIADLTEGVGRLLWLPSFVFVLMLLSLNTWTDRGPLSPGLMLVLLVNFGLSIASVVILQSAAQAARNRAVESLTAKVKRAEAAVAETPQRNDAAQAEKLLDEIHNLRRGAFVGFWQNPALSAVLVPSGATMVIQLLQWVGR